MTESSVGSLALLCADDDLVLGSDAILMYSGPPGDARRCGSSITMSVMVSCRLAPPEKLLSSLESAIEMSCAAAVDSDAAAASSRECLRLLLVSE